MKILITGAGGFVGSRLFNVLKNNHEVVGFDNEYNCQINDSLIIKESVSGEAFRLYIKDNHFDLVIHLAAQASGEVSFEDPRYDLETNYLSTLNILEGIKNRPTKLIYASSMSVYGDVYHQNAVTEKDAVNPKSIYALHKLSSENLIGIYSKLYGLNAVSLRLFNIFGPGQNLENLKQGMVSIFLKQALVSDTIVVKGSLSRYRDQIYIEDVVDAFLVIINDLDRCAGYEIYNVSTGIKTSVADVINHLERELNKTILVSVQDGTPGDQYGLIGSCNKILDAFDWKPKYDFSSGIKKMISWATKC